MGWQEMNQIPLSFELSPNTPLPHDIQSPHLNDSEARFPID